MERMDVMYEAGGLLLLLHHHIITAAIITVVMCVVCSVLHFHSKTAEAAQATRTGPAAAAVGAPSFTLRYAAHSVFPMTLAMMHTYLRERERERDW